MPSTSPRNRSGYSDNDLMKMQQDAVRRVREMQKQAQRTLENSPFLPLYLSPSPSPSPSLSSPASEDRRPPSPLLPLENQQRGQAGEFSEKTSLQLEDGQMLLLGILLLLLMEKADITLILALGYILL